MRVERFEFFAGVLFFSPQVVTGKVFVVVAGKVFMVVAGQVIFLPVLCIFSFSPPCLSPRYPSLSSN